jgi:hypothetical protein
MGIETGKKTASHSAKSLNDLPWPNSESRGARVARVSGHTD